MGWNSWNCYGIDVREEQVRAVADYMAENLKQHGGEYVVVDMGSRRSRRSRPVGTS